MSIAVQAYRKLQKKREKEKHKKARQEVREAAKLLLEPDKLKKELDELSHKSIIGRIDEDSLSRKDKLEKLWEKHSAKCGASSIPESAGTGDVEHPSTSESSSDDDRDSDDSGPTCAIAIGNTIITPSKPSKRRRKEGGDAEDDEFVAELLKNAPPVLPAVSSLGVAMSGSYAKSERTLGSQKQRQNPMIHKDSHTSAAGVTPYIHTVSHYAPKPYIASIPPPPPPPPKKVSTADPGKSIAIGIVRKEPTEQKVVPMSSYFVPTHLRMKKGKG
ncbi:hypothetical protein BgAZ_400350 [Babesia gibsoni]|uniref:Wbp11/ELF5/Saf1 N-terminal domain-containing protein n=1 Tax=Babesia gibsoni TaxID=33632 RepID=A0AAD8P7X8_BABGI|nr:hypothetical protein BgAZ_400350 [Babesia gibsoni]